MRLGKGQKSGFKLFNIDNLQSNNYSEFIDSESNESIPYKN